MFLVWLALPVVIALAVALPLVLVLRSGTELCRASPGSGEPWSMSAHVGRARVLTLWCEVDLALNGALELRGPIAIRAETGELWGGTFALGPGGSTTAGSGVRIKRRWIRTRRSVRGVARVAKLAVPSSVSAVTVEGIITAGPGTVIRRFDLFLAGR